MSAIRKTDPDKLRDLCEQMMFLLRTRKEWINSVAGKILFEELKAAILRELLSASELDLLKSHAAIQEVLDGRVNPPNE